MTSSDFASCRSANVNGVTLAYREQGSGASVVFVHGTACDLRIWDNQLGPCGEAFRAVAYSRRYARPNEDIPPDADDQMLPHVEDLIAFLREIDAVPVHLVGSSWGGFISLLTAIREPEMLRSLVLLEPPVLPLFMGSPPSPAKLLKTFVRRPRTALALIQFGSGAQKAQAAFKKGQDEQAMRIFIEAVSGHGAWEQTPEPMQRMMRENLTTARAQLLGAGFPPLGDDDVRGVRTPTLLLQGAQSPPFLKLASERLAELLPSAEQIEVADASHTMQVENPAAVNEAILDFLGRGSSSA